MARMWFGCTITSISVTNRWRSVLRYQLRRDLNFFRAEVEVFSNVQNAEPQMAYAPTTHNPNVTEASQTYRCSYNATNNHAMPLRPSVQTVAV